MKLTVRRIKEVELVETDLDLPVYLHFQGEMGDEEFVRVDENGTTTVEQGFIHASISLSPDKNVNEWYIKNNLSSEEVFESALSEVLGYINRI